MHNTIARFGLGGIVSTFALFLAACGGGGGGSGASPSSPPPVQTPAPTPTAEEIASARSAQVNTLFKAGNGELTIKWTDTFANETGYRVERQLTAGGNWEVQEALPAAAATGSPYTWTRTIDQSAAYRVVATTASYVVPLEPEPGISAMQVNMTTNVPQLVLDQTSPMSGIVNLSVQGNSVRRVEYFIDLQSLGVTLNSGSSFRMEWDTRKLPEGMHLVIAHVEQAAGLIVELRQEVVTDNPNVAVTFGNPVFQSGILHLTAVTTSNAGISSVEFFKDGVSIGMGYRESPNDPTYDPNVWLFEYDVRQLPPGPATFRAVATDNNGEQAEVSRQINIDNSPLLTLQTPLEGQIVTGSLDLQGTFSDDLPNAVVTAHLGDVQIFQSSQASFSHSYSLSGLPGGQYTLTVQVRDSSGQPATVQRAIVVAPSSSAFSYQRVATLAVNTSLVQTAAGRLLYRLPNGTMRLRLADSTEVDLQGSAQISPIDTGNPAAGRYWRLSADRVAAFGRLNDIPKVFLFDDSGAGEEVPYDTSLDPVVNGLRADLHGPWLVWGSQRIYMRNVSSPAPDVGPVAGKLDQGHGFTTTPGSEALFFVTGGDLFRFNVADQSTMLLVSGANVTRPSVDQSNIAWQIYNPPQLVRAPLSNPTATTVLPAGSITSLESLDDGILTWTELRQGLSGPTTLLVNDGTTTTTLSNVWSTALYSAQSGTVIFGENGKLYVWTAAQGKRVLLDALPGSLVQRDNVVFFTTGASALALYQVNL